MENENQVKTSKRDDFPGEKEKRNKMRSLYGENVAVDGEYDVTLAVKCVNGTFVGKKRENVRIFKGIPFAKPPVGELRWKSPEPVDPDDGVYTAYYYGHSPIQTEWPSEEGSYYPQSENCLTLNVWTADVKTDEKRPVMVFFHGGSYGWGATSDPIYDGFNLVSEHPEIVLVTAEYRTGIMGFMDFSEVPGGEEYKTSGNLGLLDHVEALKWVKNNISAFGGDPETVTVFGESAGGGTVSLLTVMPQAKGLFKRAIAESGSSALTYSKEECKRLTRKLLKETGVKTMRELVALDESVLKTANENLNDYNNFPERDGVVIPEDLYGAFESGASKEIDFMQGTNADEVKYWIREMGYYTEPWLGKTTFKLGMPVMFDSDMKNVTPFDRKIIDDYFKLVSGRKLWKIVAYYNDILFRVPASEQAGLHAKNGGKGYVYYWTYPSAKKDMGACHAIELAYVFNNLDVQIYTGDNICVPLAKEVQQMWVNFAVSGDPSTEKHKWLPYDIEKRNTAVLGRKITFVSDNLGERRKALQPVLKYYFNGCYTNIKINIPPFYVFVAGLAVVVGAIPTGIVLLIKAIKKGIKNLFKKNK